jgi:hypothetical protein
VKSDTFLPTFRRNRRQPSSGQKCHPVRVIFIVYTVRTSNSHYLHLRSSEPFLF